MKVVAAPPQDWFWLIERAGCSITPQFTAIEARDLSGRIQGMVGYDLWTENGVWMHIAVDTPLAMRPLLRWAFYYPFIELDRGVAFASVRASNEKSQKLCEGVGMTVAWRCKDGVAKGEDLIVYEMRKEACKWLEPVRKAG